MKHLYKMKLNNSKKKLFTNAPFFLGLVLNVFVVKFFAKTVVSPSTILLLYLITGTIFYFIIDKFFKLELNQFLKFVYCSVSFGGLLSTILLLINLNFESSTNREILKVKILKKGLTTRGKHPKIDAQVDGIVKGFIFHNVDDITEYSSVQLHIREGKIGWKTIEQIQLKK